MYSRYLWRSPALIGVAFIVIGFIGSLVTGADAYNLFEVTRDLYPGEGTVVRVQLPTRKGATTTKADVRYQDRAGVTHFATVAVSRWTRYQPGQKVGLFISGVDYGQAWASSQGTPSPWDGFGPAAISLALLAIGILAAALSFQKVGLRVRALETGVPLPGRVISVDQGARRSRGQWTVTYSWTVDGHEHCASSPTLRRNEAKHYHPDDEVPVFVDPLDEANGEVDFFGCRAELEQLQNTS